MAIEGALNVLRTGLSVWSRVWRRNSTVRIQNEDSYVSINLARFIGAAAIAPAKGYRLRVTGNIAVGAVNGPLIVGIGNDKDVGLVISRTCYQPCLCFARVIGGAQVRVADTAADLETAEFMFQKNVDHTRHRIAAINGRGAILQDVDVINHWERNQIDVHPGGTGPSTSSAPYYGSALSIDENQSFFGQQTTQVGYDAAISAIGDVLVDGRAHLLRQLRDQVGCVVSAQFLNIFPAISIHRVGAYFFGGGNIRAGNDDTLHFRRCASRLGRR